MRKTPPSLLSILPPSSPQHGSSSRSSSSRWGQLEGRIRIYSLAKVWHLWTNLSLRSLSVNLPRNQVLGHGLEFSHFSLLLEICNQSHCRGGTWGRVNVAFALPVPAPMVCPAFAPLAPPCSVKMLGWGETEAQRQPLLPFRGRLEVGWSWPASGGPTGDAAYQRHGRALGPPAWGQVTRPRGVNQPKSP